MRPASRWFAGDSFDRFENEFYCGPRYSATVARAVTVSQATPAPASGSTPDGSDAEAEARAPSTAPTVGGHAAGHAPRTQEDMR